MNRIRIRVALIAIAAALLAPLAAPGDDKTGDKGRNPGWVYGKWEFDEEYTAGKHRELPDETTAGLDGLIVAGLMSGLKGAQARISSTEEAFLARDGNGKVVRHEVFEVPDAETITFKDEKGTLTTYHKDGERYWINSTGTVRVPFYFKRVK